MKPSLAILLGVAAVLLAVGLGCRPATTSPPATAIVPLSREACDLLEILQDEHFTASVRVNAAIELGRSREPGVVDRLGALLPADFDFLANAIVNGLGETRDPRSIPYIEKVYKQANAQGRQLRGELRTSIWSAIKKCSGKQEGEGGLPEE